MNPAATSSLGDVAMVVFMVDGTHWTKDDEMVLGKLRHLLCPWCWRSTRSTTSKRRRSVALPGWLGQQMNFAHILPISAEGTNAGEDREWANPLLLENVHFFPEIT